MRTFARMAACVRQLSRRTLLTDFGVAGIGLIVLGACASSSDSGSSDGGSSGSDSGPSDSASVPSDQQSLESGPSESSSAESAPGTDSAAAGGGQAGELRLEHVSLGFVSAYVLVRGGEAAIVDTGQSGSRDAIFEGLDALSVGPGDVRHVVLTHNHGDHVGGLSEFESDLTNATVYAGAPDIGSIRTSLPLTEANDGDEVFGMGVIATPGHTPGSISVFDTASGILVAGDALNGDGSGGLTGANPDFSADLDTAATSVETLAALMPSTVAFGHGGPPVSDNAAAQLAALTSS